jgi:hypothetical protein
MASEEVVRGSTLVGFVEAARHLGAPSLELVRNNLSPELAALLLDNLVLPMSWFPESYLVDLCYAVFRGPLRDASGPSAHYLDHGVDLGWGRVQRTLVAFATPKMLVDRAMKLWRREHSHGVLSGEVSARRAVLVLREHPYADTPFARALIAEVFRHILSLTRVGVVREQHALHPHRSVGIELEW